MKLIINLIRLTNLKEEFSLTRLNTEITVATQSLNIIVNVRCCTGTIIHDRMIGTG